MQGSKCSCGLRDELEQRVVRRVNGDRNRCGAVVRPAAAAARADGGEAVVAPFLRVETIIRGIRHEK